MSEEQGWVFIGGILFLLTFAIGFALYMLCRSQRVYELAMRRIAEASHD